jgi:hypothetical protein
MNRLYKPALLYCGLALFVSLSLILGAKGLGPLDDHHMFRTLFQGEPFGFYIAPEIGRFFPLTAQEYVLASKIFHPSAALFYAINASKLVLCSFLLFKCLTMTRVGNAAVFVLWAVVVYSVGVANTVYRLSAGELNLLCAMLFVVWSAQCVDARAEGGNAKAVTFCGIAVFVISLFYKELAFILGLTLGSAEYIRRLRVRGGRLPTLFIGLIVSALAYLAFYCIWRGIAGTGSYSALHAIPRKLIYNLFAESDPFLLFVAVPMTIYRFFVVFRQPQRHVLSDSLLATATVYVASYFALDIVSAYYLLPAYAFATIGVAGTVAGLAGRPFRILVVGASSLALLNTLPVFFYDVLRQKEVVNNHFLFVNDLASWLKKNPTADGGKRNLVLEGVSPGSDVEIVESLRIYLATLGVPESTFNVIGSAPTNNAGLSDLFKIQTVGGYKAQHGDLEVFNPYHSAPAKAPPDTSRNLRVAGRPQYVEVPRWSLLQWKVFCFDRMSDCAATIERTKTSTGYAAYLFDREYPPAEVKPLQSRKYRLLWVRFPLSLDAGSATQLMVSIENAGNEAWPADGRLDGELRVNLAYRWFDESGAQVMEGDRTAFPEAVFPGETATVSMTIKSPVKRGRYRLQIGPVQEGVAWFDGDPERWVSLF